MWKSLKVPFMKNPCVKGRCITSMICGGDDGSCKIHSDYNNKLDECMSKYEDHDFKDLPLMVKVEAIIFFILMCVMHPRLALVRSLEALANMCNDLSNGIENVSKRLDDGDDI